LLPQQAELFQGTIRSNIALSDPGASDAAVLAAARAAGALDWIARLPKGFDTPVGERGAGLSGGQRQMVALARAMLRRPRVLLLDEPTSDLDGQSETKALRALRAAMEGRTLIAVTHRPAVIEIVDRLIVLESGRKLLDGPKTEVLARLREVTAQRHAGKRHAGTTVSTESAPDRDSQAPASSAVTRAGETRR
jgi:ATP-binding cassette subfamily C protein LapB